MTIRRGWAAEFPTADALRSGLTTLRALGYRDLEAYSPFPVPGVEERLGLPRSSLPRWIFGGGVLGALLGYSIQWYANAWVYPLRVGGRPSHSPPAFIPITFETTILCAALVAFFGLLIALRLPELWHPVFEIDGFERASVDRFWIIVGEQDSQFDREQTHAAIAALDPLRLVPIPEPPP